MLCFLTTVGLIVPVLGILLFLIAVARSDGDLVLMFVARFGKTPDSLAGKVVWITGASSGIGENISYWLAKAGCRLVLTARPADLKDLERVKQRCLEIGKVSKQDVLILPVDVVAFETHKSAVKQVLENFKKIDILINNAGKSQRAMWTDVHLDIDRELFDINVLGPVSLTQEVLPHMLERKQGHVVVTSSLAGKLGSPNSRSYTGAKLGVAGYFECLRTEMGEHNIDVTIICPGPTFTNILMEAATGKPGEVLGRTMNKNEKRMPAERCSYLYCVAIANKLYEAWISQHPILTTAYIAQYFPDLSRWLWKSYGMKHMEKMREGK
uniref:Dehydrogenase/reductase SDR family member 7 n=1 Tax=Arion vulgaris TaxID=1028688 RepID=A0A0B7A445_9EUPU